MSNALKDYFEKKKQERAAEKRLKEAMDCIVEAEAVALMMSPKNNVETPDSDPASSQIAPATPQIQRGGCAFFPSFKSLFASRSVPDQKQATACVANPNETRITAKQKIAALVAEGWEVSPNSCEDCQLPLFSNPAGSQCCVLCGYTKSKPVKHTAVDSNSILAMSKEEHELITKKMMDKIMDGWSVVEDRPCSICNVPMMFEPKSEHMNCVICEVLQESAMPIQRCDKQDPVLTIEQPNATEVDITKNMVDRIMEGWNVVEGVRCPTCDMPMMLEPKNHSTQCVACGALESHHSAHPNVLVPSQLMVETAARPCLQIRPDPSPSMRVFRGQVVGGHGVDPTPSVHLLKTNLASMSKYAPDPTPSMQLLKTNHMNMSEPTPNMNSLRNKPCISTTSTPNVKAMKNSQLFTHNQPTPNLLAVRHRVKFASDSAHYDGGAGRA